MVAPTDGMTITENTMLAPGVYVLPHGITIAADHVTLDGSGALILGAGRKGRGVTIKGREGVTIRNLRVQEYAHGIYAEDCRDLTITECRITSTTEVAPSTIFLDIWLPAEQAYGGGILLHRVRDSRILNNDVQHQMVGLLTYDCAGLTVNHNVANYCSGFGFHLYSTSDSRFEENTADFCCRYQPRGERVGHMGADATGFLIVAGSCRNLFRRNNARLGGDGFFVAGLNPRFELRPCNDNLFEENDGSYSPNIAFEATFCAGNIFRSNIANACNYGFWLGFSSENVIEDNQINQNRQAGIAVENGYGFKVQRNQFHGNEHGLMLWSKRIPSFDRVVPKNNTSYEWRIENNVFAHNRRAIRIAADQDHGIRPYTPDGSAPHPHDHTVRNNQFQGNVQVFDLVNAERTAIEDNVES
jgi:parallel beta-helix repeat protein